MIKNDFRVVTRSIRIIKIEINDIILGVSHTTLLTIVFCVIIITFIYFSIILYLQSFNSHNIFKNNIKNKPYYKY